MMIILVKPILCVSQVTTVYLCAQGYLASLNMKAFTYINLDGVVTGVCVCVLPLRTRVNHAVHLLLKWQNSATHYCPQKSSCDLKCARFLIFQVLMVSMPQPALCCRLW